MRDHPRSRGVYPSTGRRGGASTGIIPARAGFTPGRPASRSLPTDHPRSRGVYTSEVDMAINNRGSSPLARGLHTGEEVATIKVRIIPARAGFTWTSWRRTARNWDHPRSRGVYNVLAKGNGKRSGSSPLARGLPHVSPRVQDLPGIIPARAGFTPLRLPPRR